MRGVAAAFGCVIVALLPAAAAAEGPWREVETPAGTASLAPALAAAGDDLWLSWIDESGTGPRRVLVAHRGAQGWGEPQEVAAGPALVANWADTPRLWSDAASGALVLTWPETIAMSDGLGVRWASSRDGGTTWSEPAWLHADLGPSEHSFPAVLPASGRAVWLDSRMTRAGGDVAVRTRRLGSEGRETVLDERVCECCSLDIAYTHRGPVVAYRDRSEGEIRDIAVLVETGDGWHGPVAVAHDEWKIEGCPIQGPAIAALAGRGGRWATSEAVLVAWFTAAGNRPAVAAAYSDDAGASFGTPLVLDATSPLGRVDAALVDADVGWVSWVDREAGGAALRVARIDHTGGAPQIERVAATTAGRAGGAPRLELAGDRLVLAWTEVGADGTQRVRLSERSLP